MRKFITAERIWEFYENEKMDDCGRPLDFGHRNDQRGQICPLQLGLSESTGFG